MIMMMMTMKKCGNSKTPPENGNFMLSNSMLAVCVSFFGHICKEKKGNQQDSVGCDAEKHSNPDATRSACLEPQPTTKKKIVVEIITRDDASVVRRAGSLDVGGRLGSVGGMQAASEHVPTLLGEEVDDGVVERVNDEPIGHKFDTVIASLQGQVDASAVVAAIALLQLEHAPPQLPRAVGGQTLAASF
jgi:hypothetical protein